jgi:hypothetical protein
MVRQKFHVLSLALALAFQQSLSFAPPVSVIQARDCPLTSRLAARGSTCSQKCKGTIFESASATCLRLLRTHGGAAEPKHVIARTKVPGDPKREYEDTYIGARTEREQSTTCLAHMHRSCIKVFLFPAARVILRTLIMDGSDFIPVDAAKIKGRKRYCTLNVDFSAAAARVSAEARTEIQCNAIILQGCV